ncbi:MAG: 2-C-methyl-D-erythritol 4-phosphate cytidylyltransferase [Simkaniaceae bacterium]|nr:2-C-methyl-D-erythritol 4-phosphate cytidylyltransferase [Simkaniaceae bacterium]
MKIISLILLGGGRGTRMGSSVPKVFLSLKKREIILHSFELFSSMQEIHEIVVVCPKSYHSYFPSKTLFANPGKERQDSVENGFKKTSGDIILIHDGARPFVTREDVLTLLREGIPTGAATLGSPVKNTIKQVDQNSLVEKTLDRSLLYEMHTPQLLKRELLEKGLAAAKGQKLTDDVALAERVGHPVKIVTDSSHNIKITHPIDLKLAEIL